MARKGTILNMGKVQREMSAAWKARKDAKATATPDDTTPPTHEEADRLAERAAVAVFGPAVLEPAPDASPAMKRAVGPGGRRAVVLAALAAALCVDVPGVGRRLWHRRAAAADGARDRCDDLGKKI